MSDGLFSGVVDYLRDEGGESKLLLRRAAGSGPPALYIHGATFPSALSVGYRFEGRSWMEDLAEAGFDVWAFDFAGYGGSDRPDGFARPAEGQAPIGRANEVCAQLARVVDHIVAVTGHARIAIVAHSWGTMVAGLYASRRPDRVARLVLFGPIAQRAPQPNPNAGSPPPIGGWRTVSVAQQLERFVEDVPHGHPSVLIEPSLATWGPAYLATDPESALRKPEPAVKIPAGPSADIAAAWAGDLAYDPTEIAAPTLIVRGEWDHLCSDDDARWLLSRFRGRGSRDVKIPEGAHLMHLERGRARLFAATNSFLREESQS